MDELHDIEFSVNGDRTALRVSGRTNLVDALRDELGLTGSHVGCEHGVCGACTIHLGGVAIRGCLMLAVQADGAELTTIEGLGRNPENADMLEQFVARNALQCGFCTPGMIATATNLLKENPAPSREEVRAYMSGNYCRCTGYEAIVDAVMNTAQARLQGASR